MQKSTVRRQRHLVSISQAALEYGVSTKTLRRRISSGDVKAYRMGPRLIRVDLAELDDALMRPIPAANSGGGAHA